MKVELNINEEVFVNDKGEKIPYFSCTANIGGTDIRFTPKSEDKSLLKYLIKSLKSSNGAR